MAKNEEGEQLDLIEVEPENAKQIARCARVYKKAQAVRLEALDEEVKNKKKLIALIHEADLQPVNGKYKFRAGKMIITVTPCDERVGVKDDDGEAEEE